MPTAESHVASREALTEAGSKPEPPSRSSARLGPDKHSLGPRAVRMVAVSAALAVVAALAALQSAAAITIEIPAADAAKKVGCTGFKFPISEAQFNFTSYMGAYTLPQGCDATRIKCASSSPDSDEVRP